MNHSIIGDFTKFLKVQTIKDQHAFTTLDPSYKVARDCIAIDRTIKFRVGYWQ